MLQWFLMDFEKNHESFLFPEFPISIRNLFSQTFRFQPLRQLGAGYYRMSSIKIARILQGSVPSSKVYLLGEDIEQSIPGVFDQDFLLVKEKEVREKEIWDLRTDYFELKRKFPLIGEVLFTRLQDFREFQMAGSAAFVGFSELKKFSENRWKIKKAKENLSQSPLSQLALSLYYFEKAQKYLIKSFLGNSSFYRARFIKEVGRTLFACSGERLDSLQSQSPSVLMAHAFYQIQQLANLANQDKPKNKIDFKINFPEKNGARFSSEMLNRSWIHKLKKTDPIFSVLRGSSAPLILIPSADINLVTAVNLFSGFVNLLPALLQDSKDIPLLIPAAAFEMMSLGWHWGKPFSHLSWICPAQLNDSKWRAACARASFQRLKERALLERNLILGKMISQSPETVSKALKTLSRILLVLEARENLADSILIEKCQSKLPKTSEVFKMLTTSKNILSLQTLIRAALTVLNEVPSLATE